MSTTDKQADEEKLLKRIYTLLAFGVAFLAIYFGRDILLPIALAVLLSFILTPVVARLERLGLHRALSVIATAMMTFIIIGGLAWVVTNQVFELSGKLPAYKDNLVAKLQAVGKTQGKLQEAQQTIEDIGEELAADEEDEPEAEPTLQQRILPWLPGGRRQEVDAASGDDEEAVAVKVVAMPPSPLSQVRNWLGPLVAPLTTGGLVTVLVIFILFMREDLRNRLVQIFGTSNLYATTEAMNDAASRLSRYLRMQLLINSGYGLTLGLGLHLIGLPNAALWGVLGMLLRFLPYVGPWIAATMPILLSLAVSPGWTQPLMVIGWVVFLELLVNNVVEPWLYGSSIGVSSLGVILAAIFWTWMWGPIGLIVAMPLTVCLVVTGKYVPQLRFIMILLGDRSTMATPERIYQRLLALDAEESSDLAREYVEANSLPDLFDDVLVPALHLAERDRHAGLLSAHQEAFVVQTARDLIEELGQRELGLTSEDPEELDPSVLDPAKELRSRVVCVPVRDRADESAAIMLSHLLRDRGFDSQVTSLDLLAGELVSQLAEDPPAAVVLSILPPLGTRSGRYLCKRLRAKFPEMPIVSGLWTAPSQSKASKRLELDGATAVVTRLEDAAEKLCRIVPRSPCAPDSQGESRDTDPAADSHSEATVPL